VLVSACLLGERVRYDGRDAASPSAILTRWGREGRIVIFCPEVSGGLGVPRPAAEIRGGDGDAVLDGRATVVSVDGRSVTDAFLRGARLALEAARLATARAAVLKDGSPSCGSGRIYDGSFGGVARPGPGVTAALLARSGVRVFSEREIDAADRYLAALDRGEPGAG
jgi:uncharacterized protein YbbK (DUF523 family)